MKKSADAFRTISEVSAWLETPAHVLRFWESRFSQVKPVKRAGGRRYYRPGDMLLLGGIKQLLHEDGMTIRGVQKVLREQGVKHVSALSQPISSDVDLELTAQAVDTPPADTAAIDSPPPPAPEAPMAVDVPVAPEPTDPAGNVVSITPPEAEDTPPAQDIAPPADPAPEPPVSWQDMADAAPPATDTPPAPEAEPAPETEPDAGVTPETVPDPAPVAAPAAEDMAPPTAEPEPMPDLFHHTAADDIAPPMPAELRPLGPDLPQSDPSDDSVPAGAPAPLTIQLRDRVVRLRLSREHRDELNAAMTRLTDLQTRMSDGG